MMFFILTKNLKALSKLVCILLISSIAVWNFAFVFIQNSVSHDFAIFWLNISSLGWCSIAVFALWLSLVLTEREKVLSKWYFYLIIFSITIFFIYKQWTGYLINDIIRQSYGWSPLWSESVWPWFFYAYYCSIPLTVLYIGYTTIKKRNYFFEKRIKLTITSGYIFFTSAVVTDIILPRLHIYSFPSIGCALALILASAIIYGITKYRLMVITPAYAASEILATMSDSLILIDTEGKIIKVNNAILNLLGYTIGEFIGSPAEILFPEQIASDTAGKLDTLAKENSFRDKQIFFRTKNGENIPVSFSCSALKDKEGNYIGIVGIARDMREFLQLQEREREIAAEKARTEALQEKAWELQIAYDKLKAAQTQLIKSEKMAAVGQLASGVAHEINNPLEVIQGSARSIIKTIKENDPLYMPLKSIDREALQCQRMILDLLTFSRQRNE
jgi:PAS domain S-box-containing protein